MLPDNYSIMVGFKLALLAACVTCGHSAPTFLIPNVAQGLVVSRVSVSRQLPPKELSPSAKSLYQRQLDTIPEQHKTRIIYHRPVVYTAYAPVQPHHPSTTEPIIRPVKNRNEARSYTDFEGYGSQDDDFLYVQEYSNIESCIHGILNRRGSSSSFELPKCYWDNTDAGKDDLDDLLEFTGEGNVSQQQQTAQENDRRILALKEEVLDKERTSRDPEKVIEERENTIREHEQPVDDLQRKAQLHNQVIDHHKDYVSQRDKAIREKVSQLHQLEHVFREISMDKQKLESKIRKLKSTYKDLKKIVESRKLQVEDHDRLTEEHLQTIKEREKTFEDQENVIKEQNQEVDGLKEMIAQLEDNIDEFAQWADNVSGVVKSGVYVDFSDLDYETDSGFTTDMEPQAIVGGNDFTVSVDIHFKTTSRTDHDFIPTTSKSKETAINPRDKGMSGNSGITQPPDKSKGNQKRFKTFHPKRTTPKSHNQNPTQLKHIHQVEDIPQAKEYSSKTKPIAGNPNTVPILNAIIVTPIISKVVDQATITGNPPGEKIKTLSNISESYANKHLSSKPKIDSTVGSGPLGSKPVAQTDFLITRPVKHTLAKPHIRRALGLANGISLTDATISDTK
jgi:hypothetical protein